MQSDGAATSAPTSVAPSKMAPLVVGAIGVVYGDIGTSPLYTLRQCFTGMHRLDLTAANIMGILSIIFWSLVIVVTLKYVTLIMRADNRGEGGILALTALVSRTLETQPRRRWWFVGFGIFGAAMFYGDGMITPAISVLGAVEGLDIITTQLHPFIDPIAIVIIIALFSIQRSGTARVGMFFGPIMCVWFVTLAVLGIAHVIEQPRVLGAVNPAHAIAFVISNPVAAFLALGAVVLAVTGTEALYADMGHFGKTPIRRAWLLFVMPALVLNYFGQGALLLADPAAIKNPFYLLAPTWALVPLVILATSAAVIASQAVISGAFSLTRAAIQMGYCPRLTIKHTSEREIGQIYVPFVNWVLFIAVILLVVGFRHSDNLGGAYGIAVTLAMLIDSILILFVMRRMWNWPAAGRVRDCRSADLDRSRLPDVQRVEDSVGRLVPDRHRHQRVHAADHLEEGPHRIDAPHVRRIAAARRVHREHRPRPTDTRPRNGGVSHLRRQQRSALAAAQPQAQQGAARARGVSHHGRARHSLCAARRAVRDQTARRRVPSHHRVLRFLRGPGRTAPARPVRPRRLHVRDDGNVVLRLARIADRDRRARHGQMARAIVRVDVEECDESV